MEVLLAPTVLGIIIQTVGAVIVAGITYIVPIVMARRKPEPPMPISRPATQMSNWLRHALVSGVVAVITFVVIGLVYLALAPSPTVGIISPRDGESIEVQIAETGSGSFFVSGNSERVAANPDLRVYVLVHPVDPYGAGWWIQEPVVMDRSGSWSGLAWIGDTDSPPHAGDKLDVVAIVSSPERIQNRPRVDDSQDFRPRAQSHIVSISIKATR
jgi:hypothetical protein